MRSTVARMTSAPPTDETIEAFKRRAGEARSVVHEFADWHAVAALALTLAPEGGIAVSGPAAEAGPVLLEDLGERTIAPGQEHRVTAGGAVGIVRGALEPGDRHLPFYLIWDEKHHMKYGLGLTPPGGEYPSDIES